MRQLAWCVTVGFVLGLAGAARADVVGEEEGCPDGGTPSVCHAGPYCAPTSCSGDGDCQGDAATQCRSLRVCVATLDCGGGGGPSPVDTVIGSCEGNATCQPDATCQELMLCAEPGAGGSDKGCGCTSGTSGGAPRALAFGLGLVGLAWLRRRR